MLPKTRSAERVAKNVDAPKLDVDEIVIPPGELVTLIPVPGVSVDNTGAVPVLPIRS